MEEMLEIGVIVSSHGVRGEIKVLPLTDNPERFDLLKKVYVDDGKTIRSFEITSVKYIKGALLLKFKGVEDRDTADALKTAFLKVKREDAVKLPEGSYFICDLLECQVYDEKGRLLGIIKDVLQTGSNDVYVVEGAERKQILLPALKSVVRNVSISEKRIDVTVPEGLLD